MTSSRDQRFTLAIVLITLALVAFFLAQGSMGLVGRKLAGDAPAEGEAVPGRNRNIMPPIRERRDATAMLQRNIFDSASGDLTRPKEVPVSDQDTAAVDENAPPARCESGVRLVAAMVHDTKPELSFAAISDASGKTMLYRTGMEVSGGRVTSIEVARVYLTPAGGRRCELAMFSSGLPMATPSPVAAPVVPAPEEDMASGMAQAGRIPPEEIEAGVTRVSDTKFNITRGLVTKLLENQGEIMRSARIIPHEEDGRVVGVKLYGIRRQSLLGQLGLQNGDMLRTINGYDMTSPDKALEAYSRLQTASSITVAAVRRGSPVAIDYSITE